MVAFLAACILSLVLSNTAGAQTFTIELSDLTKIYDDLYPERTATAVWDTVRYDFDEVRLGNQRYRVPQFLETNAPRTQTVEDYLALSGYRVTYTIPTTATLVRQTRTLGEFIAPVERDFNIPGMEISIVTMERVSERVRRLSLQKTWRESVRTAVTTQLIGSGRSSREGITIRIPVPMPAAMESIFGPSEKTHINISGRESITFAGETRVVDPFLGVEGRTSQSLFPSLDMKQELDVRLTGTIGDKVNIQIDHSSQALDDNANRISVNYTGYDDDVIKLIELGNTSLSLPGSQLVSFSTQSQGLFGVKVLAQLGATDMTFIASKQEGESSNASFSPTGGAIGSAEERVLRDLDYVKGKYFFFDHPLIFVGPDDSLRLDVYREVLPQDIAINPEINRQAGIALLDRDAFGTDIDNFMTQVSNAMIADPALDIDEAIFEVSKTDSLPVINSNFRLLEANVDYQFVTDPNDEVIGIELVQPMDVENGIRSLAVRYTNIVQARPPGISRPFGVGGSLEDWGIPFNPDIGQQNRVVLEVLFAETQSWPDLPFGFTWSYMMRHIYNLGLSNIDGTSFVLEIEDRADLRLDRTRPKNSEEPYIRIFGLDRTDETGVGPPDGRIDLATGIVDLNFGLLFMPFWTFPVQSADPFLVDLVESQNLVGNAGFWPDTTAVTLWTDNAFHFDGEYAEQYEKAARIYTERLTTQDQQLVNQYLITVSAVSTSKTFRIDSFNIIENSEVVSIDGSRLARGSDYDIDYETGEVTLKGGALDRVTPESRISIDYEFKPFGGVASSNLVGFNAISRHGSAVLGTTWLYESKNTSNENARVGEEPSRAVVGGINGSFQHQSANLTKIVNILPLVDTDAPSSITVNGEVAVSFPDPNTQGEAWIDDFEGSEDSDRISMTRRRWNWASPPLIPNGGTGDPQPDTSRVDFNWYNIEPELAVTKQDLNPLLDDRENSTVQSLDMDLAEVVAPDDSTSWVGVMTGFGGGGIDLTNGQFIEFWVNDFTQEQALRQGKIRIDLGTIDEDFWEPELNRFDDEDKDRDGFAAAFDDTGLDGLFNQDEPGNTSDDPALDINGDDINLSRVNGRFAKVNGTEANRVYDTEDLDGNTQMDQLNVYFSFEIDLSDSASVDIFRDFPNYEPFQDRGKDPSAENLDFHRWDAWRKYRIRLTDAMMVSPIGTEPRYDQIRHMRIWFNEVDKVLPPPQVRSEIGRRVQITEFKIQGNRWVIDGIRDFEDEIVDTLAVETDFTIGVISNKTDPGVYIPPFRPREDANGIFDKESSLVLNYDSLLTGNAVRIRKQFAGTGLDMSQYRDLHFWVHSDSVRPNVEYYYRVATNENNYYEVAVPLTDVYIPPGGGWHQASLVFTDLTTLKFDTPDSTGFVRGTAGNISGLDVEYPVRLLGNPSLFNVRFLYAGVRNVDPNPLGEPVGGQVWIDDVYVGDVRRDIDFAQRLGFSLNMAGGIMSLSGSWNRTGPDYRSLRQRRGSGSETESISLNAKTAVQHILPLGGFQVPVSGSFAQNTSKPKFLPNSDIEIPTEAIRDSLKTLRRTKSFNTSLQKRGSKNLLFKYTIDKMTTNFRFQRSEVTSPASTDTTESMNGTVGYSINWATGKQFRIPLTKTRFRWWLNSLTFRSTANRRTTQRWRFLNGEFVRDPFLFAADLTNTGSANYSPFQSLSSSFNMTIRRDLGLPHEWLGVDVGREVGRNHSSRLGWKPRFKLISLVAPDLDITSSYREDSSPNVRRPGDPRGTRNVDSSRNASLKMRFDVGKYVGDMLGIFGWDPREDEELNPPATPTSGVPPPAQGDTTATAAPADTTRARPGAKYLLKRVGKLLVDIRRINANFSQRTGNNYSRIGDRPDIQYQLGITSITGVPGASKPDRLTTALNMNLDTGVEITTNIDVQGRYTRSINDSDFRSTQTRSVSTTWPDVQLRWQGLQGFALFRPYFATAEANFNFKLFRSETGRKGEEPDNIRENMSMSPSMVFSWKNELNTNISVSYQKSTSDTRGSKSETTNLSVNLDFRKTFRGGAGFRLPIPFFRKQVQWSSQLDANMAVSYSQNGGKRFLEGSEFFEPIPKTTNFRVAPTVRYNFTQALNGSMFVDFARNFNQATDQTVTSLRLGVNVVFTF